MNLHYSGYTSNGILWRREVIFTRKKPRSSEVEVRAVLVRNGSGRLVRVEYPDLRHRRRR